MEVLILECVDIKGLTFIEVILVICIISFILMIAILNSSIALDFKEKSELREFKKDIEYARNRAIVESRLYTVVINPSKNSYTVINYNNLGKNTVKEKKFAYGIKLVSTNFPQNEVTFNYSGVPLTAGTIKLKNRKGKYIEITITPVTGRVNVKID